MRVPARASRPRSSNRPTGRSSPPTTRPTTRCCARPAASVNAASPCSPAAGEHSNGSPSAPAGSANSPKPRSCSHESRMSNYALLIEITSLRVLDVGLAARDLLDVSGVDQPYREPRLKQVEHRLPVVTSGLHGRQLHLACGKPVTQPQQVSGHRGEGAGLLAIAGAATRLRGHPHADLH